MSKIRVEFEGTFATREEAVEALRDAVGDVASGKWISSASLAARYVVLITEAEEGDGE